MFDQNESPFVCPASRKVSEKTNPGLGPCGGIGLLSYVDTGLKRNVGFPNIRPRENALLLSASLGTVKDTVFGHPVSICNVPRIVRSIALVLAEGFLERSETWWKSIVVVCVERFVGLVSRGV